jgi:hypothetical protein
LTGVAIKYKFSVHLKPNIINNSNKQVILRTLEKKLTH